MDGRLETLTYSTQQPEPTGADLGLVSAKHLPLADRGANSEMRELARLWLILADAEWLDQCAPGWDLGPSPAALIGKEYGGGDSR